MCEIQWKMLLCIIEINERILIVHVAKLRMTPMSTPDTSFSVHMSSLPSSEIFKKEIQFPPLPARTQTQGKHRRQATSYTTGVQSTSPRNMNGETGEFPACRSSRLVSDIPDVPLSRSLSEHVCMNR